MRIEPSVNNNHNTSHEIHSSYQANITRRQRVNNYNRRLILTNMQHSKVDAMADRHCPLLDKLSAELRDMIWSEVVTGSHTTPIKIDKFNQSRPPPITRECHQIREESLNVYYNKNVFEFWRPRYWQPNWINLSHFSCWLARLGSERRKFVRSVRLLYKHDEELQFNMKEALEREGLELPKNCALAEVSQR